MEERKGMTEPYFIRHKDSGRIIGVRPETGVGDVVQIEDYVDKAYDQKWHREQVGECFFKIVNTGTDRAIEGGEWDGAYRTKLEPAKAGEDKQEWMYQLVLEYTEPCWYRIVNKHYKRMLYCNPNKANNR
jgi:hypothetical protein